MGPLPPKITGAWKLDVVRIWWGIHGLVVCVYRREQ